MSDIAVRVENLGKEYRIGGKQERYKTLRDTLTDAIGAPLRRAHNLLRGQAYGAAELNETIWALKDVSFEVKKGEVVGIIGRNGAGKSTLLKILSRITEPTTGYAEIHGRVGSLLEVGTGFHPELTGRENIYLNGAILGMSRAEIDRKFDEIVDFSGVEKFIDTPVKHYSSGMGLRLGFSVAAHLEPEILVVDEVLAVGDAEFQKKCLGKMGEVAGEGRTVLFVSHNMGAVVDLCTRAVQLSGGGIVADGEPSGIITSYLAYSSNEGYVDLRNWENERQGSGPSRIQYVATLDLHNCLTSQFVYGDTVVFQIGALGTVGKNYHAAISIRNARGQLILHLNSDDDSEDVNFPSNEAVIEVKLPNLMLNDDVYHVTIWLGDTFNRLHDRVENCLTFHVNSAKLGSSKNQAPIRVPSHWKVIPQEATETRYKNNN